MNFQFRLEQLINDSLRIIHFNFDLDLITFLFFRAADRNQFGVNGLEALDQELVNFLRKSLGFGQQLAKIHS